MNMYKKLTSKLLIILSLVISLPTYASLDLFQSFTGNVGLSTDGFGSSSNSGIIQASVPAGSTVVAAYLYSATSLTFATPGVTLDGTPVTFGPRVANNTACCSLASFRADVTAQITAVINGGPGGIYNFNIVETDGGTRVDGEALVIVYNNPSLPESSIGILDGFASVIGDTTSIMFAEPLDPTASGFFAEMSLGISFSCCNQRSTINVNGSLLSENAGNFDDGANLANGSLITVGGFDDLFSTLNPSYADDTERYDLTSFVSNGDTAIVVDTINASQDDNIFLAAFHVSGIAGFNEDPKDPKDPNGPPTEVPEPSSLLLVSLALLIAVRRKLI